MMHQVKNLCIDLRLEIKTHFTEGLQKRRAFVINHAVKRIQRNCKKWINVEFCKDNTVGIKERIRLKELIDSFVISAPVQAYRQICKKNNNWIKIDLVKFRWD
jgi:hypothetical protein